MIDDGRYFQNRSALDFYSWWFTFIKPANKKTSAPQQMGLSAAGQKRKGPGGDARMAIGDWPWPGGNNGRCSRSFGDLPRIIPAACARTFRAPRGCATSKLVHPAGVYHSPCRKQCRRRRFKRCKWSEVRIDIRRGIRTMHPYRLAHICWNPRNIS